MLCDRCTNIELASQPNQKVLHVHSLLSEVFEASATCEGCTFFYDAAKYSRIRQHFHEKLIIESRTKSDSSFEAIFVGPESVHGTMLDTFLSRSESVRDTRILGRPIGMEPGSGESLDWIRERLQECTDGLAGHANCIKLSTGECELPMRVVDLSGPYEDSDVRIRSNVDGLLKGQYAALSHRWGEKMPLTSTTSNIQAHESNIPWNRLPAGFQDAIRMCRRLSILSLWIDSLCILQDSDADWETQSLKMTDVYSNAHIVLAHSCALDSTHRVLTQRQPIPTLKLSGKYAHIHLRHYEDSSLEKLYHSFGPDNWAWNFPREFGRSTSTMSTLGARGWTLQERLLARRVIFFTACQIAWQCMSCRMVESSVERLPVFTEDGLLGGSEANFHSDVGLPSIPEKFLSPEAALMAWQAVIQIYSHTQLTFGKDKLIALAGLAQRFKGSMNDSYVAGFWRKSLPWLLTWQTMVNYAKRSPIYRAPSWSWACLDGAVLYFFPVRHTISISVIIPELEILEVYVETVGDNEFGPIASAWLRVKGFCLEVMYTYPMQWSLLSTGEQLDHFGWTFDVDAEFEPGLQDENQSTTPGIHFNPAGNVLLILNVTTRCAAEDQGHDPDELKTFCIVLKKVKGRAGAYSRVGSRWTTHKYLEALGPWKEKRLLLV